MSCPALSCPVLSCPVLSCPVLSCPALSCPALPCPAMSCIVFSCPVLFCCVPFSVSCCVSCHVLPCHRVLCPVLYSPVLSCLMLSCPLSSYVSYSASCSVSCPVFCLLCHVSSPVMSPPCPVLTGPDQSMSCLVLQCTPPITESPPRCGRRVCRPAVGAAAASPGEPCCALGYTETSRGDRDSSQRRERRCHALHPEGSARLLRTYVLFSNMLRRIRW